MSFIVGEHLFYGWFILFALQGILSIMTWVEYRQGSKSGDMNTVRKMIDVSVLSGVLLSFGGLGIYITTKLGLGSWYFYFYIPVFLGLCLFTYRQFLQYQLIHKLNRK